MKKKIGMLLLIFCLCTTGMSHAVTIVVNQVELKTQVEPQIVGGVTYIPISDVGVALGTEVKWDSSTKTVTLKKEGSNVKIRLNSRTAKINNVDVEMMQSAKIIQNKAMVPLNFVATAFGAEVQWDTVNKAVLITSGSSAPVQKNVAAVLPVEHTSDNGKVESHQTFKDANSVNVVISPGNSNSIFPMEEPMIKGNINNKGEKFYYLPGSKNYDKIKMNPSRGDKYFYSEADAVAEGFLPGK
ncbi:copper amine oxidase N-terminal domain-containing protein [Filifactor villosus]|uniref:Copper amine oxidase N-terminal domain-containing protein n=1 Tax=Filifactor villosus TaxID=29374 RepID=A0ABV9QLF4_9FIRM